MNEPISSYRELLDLLKESRSATHGEIADLDRKFDAIPLQLDAIRKEQREAIDALRREMQSYFLAKAEFIPHQQFVLAKFAEYDRLIAEGRAKTPEWVLAVEDIKTLKGELKEIKKRRSATWTNVGLVITFAIGVLSFMLQFFQHVSIHP